MHSGGNPKITNLVLTSSASEYAHTFDKDTKKFCVQARNYKDIVFCKDPGESVTCYFSLYSGSPWFEDHIVGPFTVYFKGSENNIVVEIIEYSSRD